MIGGSGPSAVTAGSSRTRRCLLADPVELVERDDSRTARVAAARRGMPAGTDRRCRSPLSRRRTVRRAPGRLRRDAASREPKIRRTSHGLNPLRGRSCGHIHPRGLHDPYHLARARRVRRPRSAARGAGVARADVIGDWNLIAQQQTIPLRPTAHGESRGMAMVEGAVYDAVNAIDGGHEPYLLDPRASPRSRGSRRTRPPRPRHTTCSSRSRPRQQAALDAPLRVDDWRGSPTPFKARASASERRPRRRCSPSARTTASWRRSTSAP